MSNNSETANIDLHKKRRKAKPVGLLILGTIALSAAWIAVAYFHVAYVQKFIVDFISLKGSILRVTLISALEDSYYQSQS